MTKHALVLILCSVLLFLSAQETVTLTGTIRQLDSDEDGNPISVFLETEEGDYTISVKGKGVSLLAHVDDRVHVTGVLSTDEDGDEVLLVTSFYLVGDGDDD